MLLDAGPPFGPKLELEAGLRALDRLAAIVDLAARWRPDPRGVDVLHRALYARGVRHVGELRKAELESLVRAAWNARHRGHSPMSHALPSRRIPAEWTDEHRALADALEAEGYPPGEPEWLETATLIEDIHGTPIEVVVGRLAVISNAPLPDERNRP